MGSESVSEVHRLVLQAFTKVLKGDSETLAQLDRLQHSGLMTRPHYPLIFTLDALYRWLDPQHQYSFDRFYRALYQGDFNIQLEKVGGRVEVHSSEGRILQNHYRLVALQT